MAGGYIQEAQLVRAGFVIGLGLFDRITGVLQVDEIDAFDHAAIGNVETGYDADTDGQSLVFLYNAS